MRQQLFIFCICISSLYAQDVQQPPYYPNIFKRVWIAIVGGSMPVPIGNANSNDQGSSDSDQYIQNASLTPENGNSAATGQGSPTHIANLSGSIRGLSDDARVALERERTRQLELANAVQLEQEHERNRWFNTLVMYINEQWLKAGSGTKQNLDELRRMVQDFLQQHHTALKEIEHRRNQALQEMEEKRNDHELRKLPTLLDHDMRKTALLHQQAMEKLRYVGEGLSAFTQDKQRLTLTSVALAGVIFAAYVSKRGTGVAADYVKSLLMQPELVTATSRRTFNQILRHPVCLFKARTETDVPQPIYNQELQQQVDAYVKAIVEGKRDGLPYSNALFYGEPGTGKTLLARYIAQKLGKDYAIINAANVGQFGEKAVQKLNETFNWAERGDTVLFFDEIDAICARRTATMSELSRQIQNTVYARTGTESNKILILGATNTPDILDPALLSRMGRKIHFSLPDEKARLFLLEQYMDKYVGNGKFQMRDTAEYLHLLQKVAAQIEGFSGRDISQLARSIAAEAYSHDKQVGTKLIQHVVVQAIEQRNTLKNFSQSRISSTRAEV